MVILGVCNANDSGAALIVDGQIVAAANEERFNRKKLTREFPRASIAYVLRHAGVALGDVDRIACGAWRGVDPQVTLPALVEDSIEQALRGDEAREQTLARVRASARNDAIQRAALLADLASLGVSEDRVLFFDHHESHAATAFYCSPYEDALVLCADGRGDGRSTTVWSADRDRGLSLVDFSTELASPGAMYGFITRHLGFTPDRHEGKVTGLAGRGKPTKAYEVLARGFGYDPERRRLRSAIGPWYRPFAGSNPPGLAEALEPYSREDIAHAAQALLEDSLVALLLKHIGDRPDRSVRLCLAGGCTSNVRLNQKLASLAPVAGIYVFPQMGDGGNALGGAILASVKTEGRRRFPLPTAYLGPAFSNDEVRAALSAHGVTARAVQGEEKLDATAKLLADGLVVGWFQGRMEYGPRALGARSILVEARDAGINDSLNQRLARSEFMPFAPVTTASLAPRCFLNWTDDDQPSRFMTACFDCTDLLKSACPAVVHVDGTARPQVVRRGDNPEYHDVIERYAALTGRPALINTSFNRHEEPIVHTPDDAILELLRGGVDALVIGDHLALRQT